MDRFIDEQDPSRDRSSSPNFYSLMFGGNEGRKGLSLYPSANVNSGKTQLHVGDSNGSTESQTPGSNQSNSIQQLSNVQSSVPASPGSNPANGRTVVTGGKGDDNSESNSTQQWLNLRKKYWPLHSEGIITFIRFVKVAWFLEYLEFSWKCSENHATLLQLFNDNFYFVQIGQTITKAVQKSTSGLVI